MDRTGFKLYRRFSKKGGLTLSSFEKILKDYGLDIDGEDLRFSIRRALNLGFVEKKARRYRMPWKLCDYHIARTLGVRGLPAPKARKISTATVESGSSKAPTSATSTVKSTESENVSEISEIKIEDEEEKQRRSAHYLITDCWNSMEGFFGTLEMEKESKFGGDFARPVVEKDWQLKPEPPSQQEPMWTFDTPSTSATEFQKEDKFMKNLFHLSPTSPTIPTSPGDPQI